MEYKLYKVTGGSVKAAVETFQKEHAVAQKKLQELCKPVGADGAWGGPRSNEGLTFPGAPPDGWKLTNRKGACYMPKGKTPEVVELREKIRDAAIPTARRFQELVTGKDNWFGFMDGLGIHLLLFEIIGKTTVLKVPDCDGGDYKDWVPPEECKPLKMSEYWKLKEKVTLHAGDK